MFRALIVLISFFIFIPAFAAEKPAALNDVVSALETGYAAVQDVQADFSQRTVIASIKKEQRGNGQLLLKRPASTTAMFRFNYVKPVQQIVSNGKQVWFYQAESKQVIVSQVSTMFKGSNNIALSYLTGLGNVSKDFTISFSKEQRDKNGNYQLELVPKNPSPVLARLELTVSAEMVERFLRDGTVKDIFPIMSSVIHDIGGNETRISYSRARVNKGIDNSRFNFKIPEGVEVIKQ